MQWKSVLRMSMVAIPVMIVFGLLVPVSSIGPTARADNEDTKACSNKTHHGDYGFALEGEILGLGFQVRGVVMQHYEGEGSFTQVDHVVINASRLRRSGDRAAGLILSIRIAPEQLQSTSLDPRIRRSSYISWSRHRNPPGGRRECDHRRRQESRVELRR